MYGSAPAKDPFEKLTLIHEANSETQADIWLVRLESGDQAVLRDYSSPKRWPVRLLCRWALRREAKVHELLDGLEGIPKLLQPLGPDRYLMEWIEGAPLSTYKKTPLPESFFRELESILEGIHARGVAHGDLRNKNIMVTKDFRPMLIDFSTAWWKTSLWRRPLFNFLRSLDRRRLAKSKQKFCPESLSDEEQRLLDRAPWHLKFGRIYRHFIYPRVRNREAKDSSSPRS